MANITRRRSGELLRALFAVLIRHPTGIKAQNALADLAASVKMTEHESGSYESGGRRFEKIVRFTTVCPVKAAWMRKEKGVWSITDEGKEAYDRLTDPEAFYGRAVQLYREWDSAREKDSPEDILNENAPAWEASGTFEEAEERAWDEIWKFLAKIPPYDFQDMVAGLLQAMGYYVSWVAPPGKDGGLDILAWTDPLGTKPPRIKVQVKRQAENVQVPELRSFIGVLGEGDVGLFVTTSGFTRDAESEARSHLKRITLINRERFVELWQEHYEKLPDELKKKLPLKPIYFLAPES